MKIAGLLVGFAPLVVYGIFAGTTPASVKVALAAAAATTLFVGYRDLRQGGILPWANLLLFGGALFAIGFLRLTGLIPFMGVLIYAVLAAVTFASIAAGIPFTLQYARSMVDPRVQAHPLFRRVNVLMTGVWGGVFTVNLLLDGAALALPGLPGQAAQYLTYVVLAGGIAFTLWFPARMRKKFPPPAPADSREA